MARSRIRLLVVTGITVAALGGCGGWWWWKDARKPVAAAVATATVERGSLRVAVASTARVVSNLDVDIKSKASGTIIKLPKDISDTVKAGDLLLELDPVDEQRAVAQSESALLSSEARQEQARRNLAIAEADLGTTGQRVRASLAAAEARARDARAKAGRMLRLFEKKLASQEDADTAETSALQAEAERDVARAAVDALRSQELGLELRRQDIRLAEAAVASDRISLDLARQRLKDTTILAPMDGVVSARSVQTGTIISSGITNVGGGTSLMTVSDLSRLFVVAAVDESDIGRVALGQRVRITADAHPGKRFRGSVVRIATKGVNASNVVTFEVKIEVVGENRELLKPEMTTNVEIVVEQKEGVLTLPAEAIVQKRERATVQLVAADGSAAEREIKVGISDGARTEVVEGLAEGDKVQLRKGDSASAWRNRQQGGPPMPPMGMPMGGGRPR